MIFPLFTKEGIKGRSVFMLLLNTGHNNVCR